MNILTALSNWYILLYLGNLVIKYDEINHWEMRHSHAKYRNDLEEYVQNFTAKLYQVLYDYVLTTCIKELMTGNFARFNRHAEADLECPVVHSDDIGLYCKEELIRGIKKGFRDFNWSQFYGGKKWLQAINSLDITNPVLFIDHVVDLQHNTGSILTKNAGVLNGLDSVERDVLTFFLNIKKEGNLQSLLKSFKNLCFDDTWNLIKRFKTLYWEVYARDNTEILEDNFFINMREQIKYDIEPLIKMYITTREDDEEILFNYKPIIFKSKKTFWITQAPEREDEDEEERRRIYSF